MMNRLKRVAKLRAGGTPPSDDDRMWADDGLPWVTIADMSRSFEVTETERCVSLLGTATKNLPIGDAGTVLFAMYASLGALARLRTRATWSQAILGITPKAEDSCDADFVCYWLAALRPRLAAIARSNTQDNLNASQVANLSFPMLSVTVQRKIADYLDRETAWIDALIAKKQRAIDLVRSRRARVIGDLLLGFASRDPSLPARDWASSLPAKWPITNLGKCLERATYGFTNPMPSVDDGPYMLTANDIGDGSILYSTARRTSEEAYVTAITNKSRPRLGDVLVTKDGTLGRIARADGARACINQSVALLRPSEILQPEFLVALLRAAPYQELMAFQAGGTTIKHIYVTRIVKMPIPLPPLDAQQELAKRVRTTDEREDETLNLLGQSLAILQERRHAVITAAVGGELDVPVAV